MLEEVTSDTLTEVGGADGAVSACCIELLEQEKGELLTSSHCGGCEVVFSSPSITQ